MTPAEPQKILVADDDAINRDVLCELLQPEYTVLLARNGTQALTTTMPAMTTRSNRSLARRAQSCRFPSVFIASHVEPSSA